MICEHCGSELKGDGKFCSKCGAPVKKAENGAVRMKKGNRRNKAVIIAALAAVCVLAAAMAFLLRNMAGGSRKIEFQDFLVERCVREQLGKEWNEDITAEELSSIKDLTVTWEKDMTACLDMITLQCTYNGYVNLADLNHLTGLESLTLDFPRRGSSFYTAFENLDAIAACQNLKSLSMPLPLEGFNYNNGYMGQGYQWLADILAGLPALEDVDFGMTVPAQLQELLAPDREIDFAEGGKNNPAFVDYLHSSSSNVSVQMYRTEEITPDTEDVVICLNAGEIFDCENLTDSLKLKTLVITGHSPITEPAQLLHLEALGELPCLSAVSLSCVKADLSGMEEFPALRELYLSYCDIEGASCLQQCSRLRELSIVDRDESFRASSLSAIWESMPELSYFYGLVLNWEKKDVNKLLKNLENAENLRTLVLGVPGDCAAALKISEGPALKNLFFFASQNANEGINLKNIEFPDSLENFYCDFKSDRLAEFIKAHPNLVSVQVRAQESFDETHMTAYYNDAIEAAMESENLSLLLFRELETMSPDMSDEWQAVKNSIPFRQLYEAGIYDIFQKSAFIYDMNAEDYYEEFLGQ